jgi:hypothetical protein
MGLKTIIKGLAGIALLATFGAAQAAPAYCSSAGSHPDGLSVSNVSINGAAANDCFGAGTMGDNATATTTAAVNALAWGGGFTFLARDENNGGAGIYQGLQFSLHANAVGNSSGSFTLNVTDVNGGALQNLPTSLDLVAVLKGGTDFAAYLFENIAINAGNNAGTFAIAFTNGGGQNPALSHLDFLVRAGSSAAPEPGTAALLGIGLLGLGGAVRRKRNTGR